MPAKKQGNRNGGGNGDDLGKTNDFRGTWKRPEKKLRPHNINKVDEKHQQYTDDSNPLEGTTEGSRKLIQLIEPLFKFHPVLFLTNIPPPRGGGML